MTYVCAQCRKEHDIAPVILERGNSPLCSTKCWNEWKAARATRNGHDVPLYRRVALARMVH